MRRSDFTVTGLALSTASLAAAAGLLFVPLCSCMQQVGTDIADGTDAQASPAALTGDDGGSGGGTGCAEDPTTQVTLCSGIDACPGLTVDPSALSGCGFRLHSGAVLDLECLCGTDLCPIGVPDTCAQATSLLSGLTSLNVCEEAYEGHCLPLGAPEAGTTTTTGSSSSCDPDCIASCGAADDCRLLCGC